MRQQDGGQDEARAAEDEQYGAPRGAPGQWASCLRTVDPATLQTTRRAASARRCCFNCWRGQARGLARSLAVCTVGK
jgi:hypothetical protein